MPSFPKPKFSFPFDFNDEVDNLLTHKTKRHIPNKSNNELLIASWNIANLGLQKRHLDHYKILAEMYLTLIMYYSQNCGKM